MDFTALIVRMITLFLSVVCGYAAAKLGYLREEYNKALSDVAIQIATPMLTGRFLVIRLKVPVKQLGLYCYMYVFSSIGFIGYPLVEAMFGKSAMFYVTIFSLVFSIVCWTYGVQILQNGGVYRFDWSFLKSPCVIASVLAYVIYFSGIRIPVVIADTTSFLGNLASPLIMLVTGCALAQGKFTDVFKQKRRRQWPISMDRMEEKLLRRLFCLR